MIGTTLGSYRVVRKLGEGGMGVVFEAHHHVLGKRVVVKMLRPEMSTNQELVSRFINEARSTAHIKHPGIVEVLDFGQAPDGSAFIVMEYLDGESLAARIARERRLPVELAVAIGRQAAHAIHAAHQHGIVHRDLKPDNLFLVPDRELAHGVRVKVLDFGIAKLLDDGVTADVRTRTGALLGTPFYMSPEQCRGAQQIDHRADIYALGCIMFEMLCGEPPFRAAGLGDLIVMHVTEPPRSPRVLAPGIPLGLDAAILRALAKKPWERQQSADELANELLQLSGSHPVSATGTPPHLAFQPTHDATTRREDGQRAPQPRARRKLGLGVAIGLIAVVGAIVTIAVATSDGKREPGVASGSAAGGSAAGSARTTPAQPVAPTCGTPEACMAAAATLEGAEALAIYEPLCAKKHAPACNRAGVITGGGKGDPADHVRAAGFYQASCALADTEGCFRLAIAFHNGQGVPGDLARARPMLDTACTAGVPEACAILGEDYGEGRGVPADQSRAAVLYDKACGGGFLPACTNLGYQVETGDGVTKDLARARTLYEKACGPTSAKACENLCMVHVYGKGVDRDERAGVPFCKQGCEHGSASACTWSGYLYTKGGGVPVDGPQGLAFYDQACTAGDMKGCFAAALTLAEGKVVDRDAGRARMLYEKACDSGNSPESCTNLGVLVIDGKGGKVDLRRGLELYEMGCVGGNGLGCFKAAKFYKHGYKTVTRDETHAKELFARACKLTPSTCGRERENL